MRFDVLGFLQSNNISYITKGVNVKKNEININCPFCAKTSNPDPSYHLGIDVEKLRFSCWRNRKSHCGRTLHKLLMVLLQCNYSRACELLGNQPIWLNEDKFEHLFDEPISHTESVPLEFPSEFDRIDPSLYRCQRFCDYLSSDRGFESKHLKGLIHRYSLHYALKGQYKDRIIIPNYINSQLINWTGRSIYSKAPLRYLSLNNDQGALVSIKNCIFNSDALLRGGDILIVVEGPFDAIKVDFYGFKYGIRCTCLFNKKATISQLGYLGELSNIFNRIVVMFDAGEKLDQIDLLNQLSWLPENLVVDWSCPSHVKDPGELSASDVYGLCTTLRSELL